MPSFKFLPEIATADVAFEAKGKTVEKLFENCALAVEQTMVDVKNVSAKERRKIKLESDALDKLLFNFLSEFLFYKDAEQLLFSKISVKIAQKNKVYRLNAVAYGEKINLKKHVLHNDVKAVTYHMFEVRETDSGWRAIVILDI